MMVFNVETTPNTEMTFNIATIPQRVLTALTTLVPSNVSIVTKQLFTASLVLFNAMTTYPYIVSRCVHEPSEAPLR